MKKEPDVIEILADEPVIIPENIEETDNAEEASVSAESADKTDETPTDDIPEMPKKKRISLNPFGIKEHISKYIKSLPNNLSKKYICNSLVVCIIFAAAAAVFAFLLPPGSGLVSSRTNQLAAENSEYIAAKERNDSLLQSVEQLSQSLDEGKNTLEELSKSQESLDSIREENEALEKEKEELQSSVSSKQSTLEGLEKSYDDYSKSSVTWSSGRYTVGKNIAAGTYNVTGNGSIVISNSGSARVNESLKSEGKTYTLTDGDIIKIDGNAKFTVE